MQTNLSFAPRPPLRLLHTSDWHLGHHLHGLGREREHAAFLDWLLEVLVAENVDALLICGDVFETANPPASAQAAWFRFLGQARTRLPRLDVVVIGGNHDSAARLDAPHPVLKEMAISVIGGLPRIEDGDLDLDRLLVPLHDREGEIAAWVAAVPYLRQADLPRVPEEGCDPLVEGVRRIYAEVLEAGRQRCGRHRALVATGHCYMVGTALSELSERRILGGNQHALPADIFPPELAYVALGHLHRPQRVGGRDPLRYSGSPLPLSMAEADYRHEVVLVDIEETAATGIRCLPVPRAIELLRLPERGPAELDEVLRLLLELEPRQPGDDPLQLPYLEVRVLLDEPRPGLRRDIEEAVANRRVRLVRIVTELTGDDDTLADRHLGASLRDLQPEEVFLRRWRRDHEGEPPPELLESFHDLLDSVHQEAGS